MHSCSRTALKALVGGVLLGSMSLSHAFNVAEFFGDPTQASKWGGSNLVGTPGGIVTWSLIPEGTAIDATSTLPGIGGTSNLAGVFAQVGGEAAALALIQSSFDAWSSVADIQFVRVTDDGTPFDAPYAPGQAIGSIRIGAYALPGFTGAVGFTPPPNGGRTLEGDIIFNASNTFGIAPGAEGDAYELYPASNNFFYLNDFQGLFTHELGHAIGLLHSSVPTALMCGFVDAAFDGSACDYLDPDVDGMATINRLPDADDVAGARHLYGPAPVPEPRTYALFAGGLALLAVAAIRRGRLRLAAVARDRHRRA